MGEATTEVYSCNNDVVLCACLVWAIWLRVYKHVVYTAPVYPEAPPFSSFARWRRSARTRSAAGIA